jgi:glycosyltransferase 2 family protein
LKAAAIRTARLAVAGGLTAYILWKSNPREVLAVAAAADWRPFAVAVVLVIVDRGLMAYRWIALLYTLDPVQRPPLASILRVFFVSTFLGSFLPSVGGDAVRAYSIARLHIRGGDAVASVFMDRMLGVAALFLMALAGLTLAAQLARNWVIVASLAVAGGVCAMTLLLVFGSRKAFAPPWVLLMLSRLPAAAQHAGHRLLESIQRYAAYHAVLATVLACSVAVQAIRIFQAYYLGRSLQIETPLGTYFAVVPLILLVMLLPVTVSGLGTGQAAFVWFFGQFGVPAPAAFALSVLFVGLGVVGNLPGGILYAWGSPGPE